jgi:phosphoenolpyruvate synthase/pyruvate phosphate dikinase
MLVVVVQRMVEAEFVSVMFTANTITGTRLETHVVAKPGLGEAVTSGLVPPTSLYYVADGGGRQIVERRACQEIADDFA